MELRHLSAFVAVAEELHFGRAAKRLQMAQPPLSQQIRQLEKELGVQLFERNTRSVRLTSAGESFLQPVRTVLDDLDTAVRAAKAAGRGEYGRVTIGFAGASSHETLPHLTRAVRAAHPALELVMRGQTYANVALDRVADGSLDLGFVRLPVTQPGVAYRVIDEEELVCALPFDHRLARLESVPIDVLAEEPFVSFPANTGSTVRDAMVGACEAAGFNPGSSRRRPTRTPSWRWSPRASASRSPSPPSSTSSRTDSSTGPCPARRSGSRRRWPGGPTTLPPRCGRYSPWRRTPCPRRRARARGEPPQADAALRRATS